MVWLTLQGLERAKRPKRGPVRDQGRHKKCSKSGAGCLHDTVSQANDSCVQRLQAGSDVAWRKNWLRSARQYHGDCRIGGRCFPCTASIEATFSKLASSRSRATCKACNKPVAINKSCRVCRSALLPSTATAFIFGSSSAAPSALNYGLLCACYYHLYTGLPPKPCSSENLRAAITAWRLQARNASICTAAAPLQRAMSPPIPAAERDGAGCVDRSASCTMLQSTSKRC
jgi:hypothetical protein